MGLRTAAVVTSVLGHGTKRNPSPTLASACRIRMHEPPQGLRNLKLEGWCLGAERPFQRHCRAYSSVTVVLTDVLLLIRHYSSDLYAMV
jgi:hypothetical protein